MKERIDIIVPESVLAEDAKKTARLHAAGTGDPVDRVPVRANENQWTCLAARGVSFAAYTRDPRTHLRHAILNRKWRLETIRDDTPMPTETLHISPDFGCLRGVEFSMEIQWQEDGPPKAQHPLHEPEAIDTLAVPDPEGGLNAHYLEWTRAMLAAAEDFDVRLNGTPLELAVSHGHGGGPIPSAFALCGTNLFLWMLTDPDRVHRLMEIVTTSFIQCVQHFDGLFGRPREHPLGMGCDTGEMLSPEQYREFVVPYYQKVWEHFPGPRGLHMCGRIDHLLTVIRDELVIAQLNGFGCPTDRHQLAAVMAGRVIMSGGPDPVLIQRGPVEAIKAECRSYIDTVGQRGGYTLCPGGGAAVGTPSAHFAAMVEASREAAEARVPA